MPDPGSIRIGIAGWSYADWKGIVYPRGCSDPLRFCAELVDCLEINNTFYRIPDPRHAAAWAARVGDLRTTFTAKLPRDFTHTRTRDAALARRTRDGFQPLRDAGKLDALLAQFDYRFARSASALQHLEWLHGEFHAVAPTTLELRHRSWADPTVLADLGAAGFAVANLDYPGGTTGFDVRATGCNGAARRAYVRLHGRNHAAWFDRNAGRDQVYDYEYGAAEVRGLEERIREIGAGAAQTTVIANNHFAGKAMKLALELLAWSRGTRVRVPESMVRRYPALAAIAVRGRGELFD